MATNFARLPELLRRGTADKRSVTRCNRHTSRLSAQCPLIVQLRKYRCIAASDVMGRFCCRSRRGDRITLTLHTPNEAAAFSARALKVLDTTDLNECHNAMLTKRTRTHVPAAHVR